MSVAQLERAATAPSRLIALSFSKDRTNDGLLPRRSTRMIRYPPSISYCSPNMYLIPGGRYLVAAGMGCLNVFDLSSEGTQTKMWTTTLEYTDDFVVHPTPDGQGIRILITTYESNCFLYVYEIYPQQDNPRLVQIAKIVLKLKYYLDFFLCGDRAIIHSSQENIVIVWDFMTNTLASWSVGLPTMNWNYMTNSELINVSDTAIMFLDCYSVLWIFHIPPLITKIPLFDIERDVPEVAPILKFKCLEQAALSYCLRPDCWYFGDPRSLPFYLEVLDSSQTGLSKLEVFSDLSNHSVTRITNEPVNRNLDKSPYRICEDSCVNVVIHRLKHRVQAITVGSNPSSSDLSQTPNAYVNWTPLVQSDGIRGFCPASARLVYTGRDHFVICDFF